MRQVVKQGTHAIAVAAVLLTAAMAESHAGRFLDDRDFEEAMSLSRPQPAWNEPVTAGRTPSATLPVPDESAVVGESIGDPAEEVNRLGHLLNQQLRRFVLDPVSEAYIDATSAPVRLGMANVFSNLREPVWLAGHILKGDWNAAETTAARFAINTTVGLGGIRDEAAGYGLDTRKASLDEVFCHYGIGPGPYIVLPVLGPSSVRDVTGRILTIMAQYAVLGVLLVPYRIADITIQYVTLRDDLRYLFV
jgi:phospholipid-binding lipoprotein MlaA